MMVFLYKLSFYTMNSIHLLIISLFCYSHNYIPYKAKQNNIIIIIVFMFYIFECTYLARNNYSEKTAFEV